MKMQRILLMPRKYFSFLELGFALSYPVTLSTHSMFLRFWAHSSSPETSSFINSLTSVPDAEARWI